MTGPAGVGLCDGDGRVEAVGKADGDGKGRPDGKADPEGDGDPDAVAVTLGETATAAGGGVDSRQAASASKPSNAGPATPSYRIPRR